MSVASYNDPSLTEDYYADHPLYFVSPGELTGRERREVLGLIFDTAAAFGIWPEELCEATGISQSVAHKVHNSTWEPSPKIIADLRQALRQGIARLQGGLSDVV